MNKDLSQNSVAVYTARRKNKSIWRRSCMALALLVAVLTGYLLAFPARTVEKELICGMTEHVHDENCYLSVLSCGLEEGEEHSHTEACWSKVLICAQEEHVHGDSCYAEPEPVTEPGETWIEGETDSEKPTAPAEESEAQPDASLPVQADQDEAPVTAPADEPDAAVAPAPDQTGTPGKFRTGDPVQGGLKIEFPEEGVDLAPYLYSVVFQRQQGGAMVEDTWFENGETAKAAIIYDIPKGIVTPDSKYVYYQLPEGVRPIEETSGDVMDEGVAVGVYTITEDGMIHILFNDDFANGNAIMGTVEFTSWLYANEDGTDREVTFENGAGGITITVPDQQKYDLSLEKTGSFNSDYTRADFILTVSSEKGTGAAVTVIDVLTNQTPATLLSAAYDQEQFQIWHVAADGSRTLCTDYSLSFLDNGMHFEIEGLPALEANERYEVRYSVELEPDLSGSFELDNDAKAIAGEMEATSTFFISYVCDITKSGEFNPTTGLIDWVITVNPESRPVAGWRIEDDLPYPAVGKVLLTNGNGVIIKDITPEDGRSIRYIFPSNAPARPYFIRYSTAAPSTTQTVSNSVRLINENDTTVTAEVEVSERNEGVKKTVGASHVKPNGMVQTTWSFKITLPAEDLDHYSFRDNISTTIEDLFTGEEIDRSHHFGYAAELDATLRGNLRLVSEGKSWYYGDESNDYVRFALTYYDLNGNVLSADDESSHVAHIAFEVTPLQGETFRGYEIDADDYPTWLDADAAAIGDAWSYKNTVLLHDGIRDIAYASYRKGDSFMKQLKVNGKFTGDDAGVAYPENGELEYRLLIDLAALEGDSFVITDLLPRGMSLVSDSPRAYFTGANLYGEYDGTFSREGNFTVDAVLNADNSTRIEFRGAGVTDEMKHAYSYIGVVYRVRLDDESLWNDYTHSIQSYTNTAVWNGFSADHTVTVERQPKRLEKNGQQLMDEEGSPIGRVRFSLLINAGAEDLDHESDWITLTDQFSSGISSTMELNSLRLYRYDPTRPDGLGNRVMPYEFRLFYEPAEKCLTVQLRDETAYVLVYDYSVDYTAILDGQTTVSNSATLAGVFHDAVQVELRGVSSSATAWQRVITITKVDEDNNAKVLPGAVFMLEYWDKTAGVWSRMADNDNPEQIFVTNEAGQIVLMLVGSEKDLESGTLYRMTEIKAPAGYELEDTKVFFLCMPKTGQTRQEVFEDAAAGSGTAFEEVHFFGLNGGSCVVTNPFNGLTVDKRWFYKGVEMTDPKQESINVTLYVSTDPSGETGMTLVPAAEGLENPVQLRKETDWTFTWDKLPSHDEDGNALYYFVEEDPVPGYTPSYINNGITGGTIVIQNDCEPYVLPSTGGIGTGRFVGFGVVIMAAVTCVYIIIKKRKMEDVL